MRVANAAPIGTKLQTVVAALHRIGDLAPPVQWRKSVRATIPDRHRRSVLLAKHDDRTVCYGSAQKLAVNDLARPRRHIPGVCKHPHGEPFRSSLSSNLLNVGEGRLRNYPIATSGKSDCMFHRRLSDTPIKAIDYCGGDPPSDNLYFRHRDQC